MNPLRIFIGAFFCPATYRTAREPQQGLYLFYSFLLVLVTSAVIVIVGASFLQRMFFDPQDGKAPLVDQFILSQAQQMPVMTLQNGTLQVKAKQPYIVNITISKAGVGQSTDYPWATIDTTGATTMHNMATPVLIAAHEIYIKSDDKAEVRVYPYEKITTKSSAPLIINRALVMDSAHRSLDWLHQNLWKLDLMIGIPMWLMFALVAYVLRLIMLMALALVGLIVSRILNLNLEFAPALRVAAVAYTPVAAFTTIALCLTAHAPGVWILLLLGSLMVTVGLIASQEA